jgi:hypothetical protein
LKSLAVCLEISLWKNFYYRYDAVNAMVRYEFTRIFIANHRVHSASAVKKNLNA